MLIIPIYNIPSPLRGFECVFNFSPGVSPRVINLRPCGTKEGHATGEPLRAALHNKMNSTLFRKGFFIRLRRIQNDSRGVAIPERLTTRTPDPSSLVWPQPYL